jgi:formamidopyrimidine-DNA glycosylase
MSFSEDGAELPPEIAHIARDPLDPLFDPDEFSVRLRRRQTGVKRALLDQTLISGVGNIYADEALWRTPLHYARNARHLRRREVDDLLRHVREVMVEALAQGGTSFDALYVNVNGNSGYFERSLAVYGQAGRPCPRCGSLVRRDAFMNRSSFTCPRCQPRPRHGKF